MVRVEWLNLRLLVMVLLIGCPKPLAVWVPPDSTRSHLVFRIGNHVGSNKVRQFTTFLVRECTTEDTPDNALWLLYLDDFERRSYPTSIVYGLVPPGYRERAPARTLGTGCHIASADGASAKFTIGRDGQVSGAP